MERIFSTAKASLLEKDKKERGNVCLRDELVNKMTNILAKMTKDLRPEKVLASARGFAYNGNQKQTERSGDLRKKME